jgi:nucleotide-binding universal stress UspA family protein
MNATESKTETTLYERIVVPLDRSKQAEVALDHATTLAKSLAVPIHLLHIVDITPLAQASLFGIDDVNFVTALALVEAETEAATNYLEDVGQRLANQGLAPSFEVRRGLVVPDLLEAMKPSDLVIMVTRRRKDLKTWILGDDTEAVIRRSSAPILLVHADAAVAVPESSDVAA